MNFDGRRPSSEGGDGRHVATERIVLSLVLGFLVAFFLWVLYGGFMRAAEDFPFGMVILGGLAIAAILWAIDYFTA